MAPKKTTSFNPRATWQSGCCAYEPIGQMQELRLSEGVQTCPRSQGKRHRNRGWRMAPRWDGVGLVSRVRSPTDLHWV